MPCKGDAVNRVLLFHIATRCWDLCIEAKSCAVDIVSISWFPENGYRQLRTSPTTNFGNLELADNTCQLNRSMQHSLIS